MSVDLSDSSSSDHTDANLVTSNKDSTVVRIKFRPIFTQGESTNVSAIIVIDGNEYRIAKDGGVIEFEPSEEIKTKKEITIEAKLYIYDRQPNTNRYFTITSTINLTAESENSLTADLCFCQDGPFVAFFFRHTYNIKELLSKSYTPEETGIKSFNDQLLIHYSDDILRLLEQSDNIYQLIQPFEPIESVESGGLLKTLFGWFGY